MNIWFKLFLIGLIVAAVVKACVDRDEGIRQEERERVTAQYELKVKEMRLQYEDKLRIEHERVRAAEVRLTKALRDQEKKDVFNQTQVKDLQRRLDAAIARGAGRLRDPNGAAPARSQPAGAVAATAEHRAADRAETAGLLSESLTRLLRDQAREADEINAAYASCRADLLRKSGGLD